MFKVITTTSEGTTEQRFQDRDLAMSVAAANRIIMARCMLKGRVRVVREG